MTLRTELVTPEGAIWSGAADRVIAKTLDGDIGVLTGHAPVLGILVAGSVVRILPENEGQDRAADWVTAAVSGGFFSVADNRVSILARQAQLGNVVDQQATRATLDQALQDSEASGEDGESADVRYLRALLTASGDIAGSA
jgi:F-type H+-transporting ATPase subunit epsilon